MPEQVRQALSFACAEAARLEVLSNGETALFFDLIATVNRHIKAECLRTWCGSLAT